MALAAVICIKNASLHFFWTEVNNITAFSASGFPLKFSHCQIKYHWSPARPPQRPCNDGINGTRLGALLVIVAGNTLFLQHLEPWKSQSLDAGMNGISGGLTLYVAVCYDITMIQHWNYHVCHMLLYVAVSPIYITVIQNWNDHWFVAEQWYHCCCCNEECSLPSPSAVPEPPSWCNSCAATYWFHISIISQFRKTHLSDLAPENHQFSPIFPYDILWPFIILRCQVTSLGSGQLMVFFPHGQAVPSLTHCVEKPVTTPFLS